MRRALPSCLFALLATLPAACATDRATSDLASRVPLEALNPDVRPETIDQTICVPGYAASVRPSTSYTTGVKLKLLREAGVPNNDASNYELDHIIPLAIGGHPRGVRNLNPMLRDGDDGARKKARLDKQLQRLVCSRHVGLREAQATVYADWKAAYKRWMHD